MFRCGPAGTSSQVRVPQGWQAPAPVFLCDVVHEVAENPNPLQAASKRGCLRAGLAFGAFLGETQHVTDAMLVAASETLPALIRPTDLSAGRVFPRLADIRRATLGSPARAAQHGAHANVRHVEAPMYLLWYGTWQLGRPCRPLGDDSWEAQQLKCAAGTSMIGSGRAWSDCRAQAHQHARRGGDH